MSRGAGDPQQVESRDRAAAGRQHRIDHQHVGAGQIGRQLRIVPAKRPPSARRAAGRCGRRARSAAAPAPRRACRARRAAPARRRRPGAPGGRERARAASGPTTSSDGTSRVASAASSRLIRIAIRRNSSGGVVTSRSVASASCTTGCSNHMQQARRHTITDGPRSAGRGRRPAGGGAAHCGLPRRQVRRARPRRSAKAG